MRNRHHGHGGPRLSVWLTTLAFAAAALGVSPSFAQVNLGTAANFGVLGGSAVTNTGPSVVNGSLGVSPGSAITGFPPGTVVAPGIIHSADAVAAQAQVDLATAYSNAAGLPTLVDLTGIDLGGLVLTPGVYNFATSAQLTGNLTLNALGNPNALFVFKMGSTLTTASGSSVTLINGGSSCNVYWQVGSSATLGTTTSFAGNIMALASITLNTGASLSGRALARTGAVTLASNTVSPCTAGPVVCPTITLNPLTLPNASPGTAYNQTVVASGGVAPYTYAVTSGAMPPGLALNPVSGAITGLPTGNGSFSFTITATDANGCLGSRLYTIVLAAVVCPTISMFPAALAPMTVGMAYSQVVSATGGTAPYTFTVVSGALPPGLLLNPATGVIAGVPTAAGNFAFTIGVTDANGCPAAIAYLLSNGVIADVSAIPTLSEWGLLLLVLIMMTAAGWRFRRR